MSTQLASLTEKSQDKAPMLQHGDRLTRAEFERRYQAMPQVKKAELVEGVVYMPSPVSADDHGVPHSAMMTWIGVYRAHTPGVEAGDNSTVRLDADNEVQPDGYLRRLPEQGGQSRTVGGFVEGAPELIVEVSASTASYDLHDKKNAYRRNGVKEYIVWRVWDREIDWFILREGLYERLPPGSDGIFRSIAFPGLWLDAAAMIQGNVARVLQVLQLGIAGTPKPAPQ